MNKGFFAFRRALPLAVFGLAFISCERIPEIERRTALGKKTENVRHLVEVKKWLWTCRGVSTNISLSKGKRDLGESIENFVDFFQSKGLSSVTPESATTLLGTAVLWKAAGYLVTASANLVEVKDIECSNGTQPWTKVSIRGQDRSLDISVLKLDPSVLPQLKNFIPWEMRSDAIGIDENLSVISSAYPGQIDRLSVQRQPFSSSMHTGIDDDLILFLPPIPEVSAGGLLVDGSFRVVGYLLPHQTSLWGVALSAKRTNFSVTSIIESGKVVQAYAGFKLGVQDGKFFVQQIEVGSPAYRAGLRVDDLLVKWDKRELHDLSDWREMSAKDIGRSIPLTYRRGDKTFEAQLVLSSME